VGPTRDSRVQSHCTQLMDVSERLILSAAHAKQGELGAAARRLAENATEWQLWERQFGAAVRRIVIPSRRAEQIRLLRLTGFSLIHSAVPFRSLRDARLRGAQRRRVIVGLHSGTGFMQGMVTEHRNFIRSTCSLACAMHIGAEVLADDIFAASMRRYQALYEEYFETFCRVSYFAATGPDDADPALLPLLKMQVTELRSAILRYPQSAHWLEHELLYRTRSGDTAQLPRLK
jgi:hypothetical protein